MLRSKLVILVAILLLSFFAKGQQDGSVFERRVNIQQTNKPLEQILEQISWQAGVYFSYDASIVNSEDNHTVHAQDKSLFTVLKQLFNPEKFKLQELENQIIISEKQDETVLFVTEKDTIPEKYFFLSGKLIDNKKGRPVKYASVSVFKKPIGTISNIDGEFLLKVHPENINDTVVVSCMGYAQVLMPAHNLLDEDLIVLKPISIRIREVKVTGTSPYRLLENIRENLELNYSSHSKLMTGFYRETVKQDDNYINVSEAVLEILKSPYVNTFRDDLVRLKKGRKSPDVQPFRWLNFKLQGGPFNITRLDVVKTLEGFIDEKYQEQYKYEVKDVIWYKKQPVYVLHFHPVSEHFFPGFVGEMYVHRQSYAIVHVNFRFNKHGLKEAESILIKKKPRGVRARPSYVQYHVNYQQYQGKWHLATAHASVKFKVKSKRDKVNSEFHSVSDLLISDIKPTELKRFPNAERFKQRDIFTEMLGNYDEQFWEHYNIIKPNENLRKAFKMKE